MPIFILALGIGALAELADAIGRPATIGLSLVVVWLMTKVGRRLVAWVDSDLEPPSTQIGTEAAKASASRGVQAATAERSCMHCGAPATRKSPDSPFLWCSLHAGPNDDRLPAPDPAPVAAQERIARELAAMRRSPPSPARATMAPIPKAPSRSPSSQEIASANREFKAMTRSVGRAIRRAFR